MISEHRIKILNKLPLQSKFKYFDQVKELLSKLSVDELLLISDATAIHRINESFYGIESEEYEYNTKLNIELYLENVLDYYSEKTTVTIEPKWRQDSGGSFKPEPKTYNIHLFLNNGLVYAQCIDFKNQDGEYYFVEELTKLEALEKIKDVIKGLTE